MEGLIISSLKLLSKNGIFQWIRVTRYVTGYLERFDIQTMLKGTEADRLRTSVTIKEVTKSVNG